MPIPRICYLEIPTEAPQRSADFYAAAFEWKPRARGDGTLAFDDGGDVSGAFVAGREPQGVEGVTTFILVDDAEEAVGPILACGGTIVRPLGHSSEIIALFQDPGGNVLGIYQEPN